MIDLTQPPNVILKQILQLPLGEQQYWIEKWQSQIPADIDTSIPNHKPSPVYQDWQDDGDDALDRTRRGKFGRKEKQEYAKAKSEAELKAVLEDPVEVAKCSKAFKDKVNNDLERLGIK